MISTFLNVSVKVRIFGTYYMLIFTLEWDKYGITLFYLVPLDGTTSQTNLKYFFYGLFKIIYPIFDRKYHDSFETFYLKDTMWFLT